MALDKVLYSAHVNVTGGRDGVATSSDGALDVRLVPPRELGGSGENGTNPEQLFAAGYAACFLGAMKVVAVRQKLPLPEGTHIDSSVDIGPMGTAFAIQAELKITLPGMERAAAQSLVDMADRVCPYSNATRGNIDVTLLVA